MCFCSNNEQDEFVGVGALVALWRGETIDRASDGERAEVGQKSHGRRVRERVCRAPHSNSRAVRERG